MKVMLDTNFIISAVKFRLDLFQELKGNEIFISESVLKELKKIGKENGRDGTSAKIGLELAEKNKIEILKSLKEKADLDLIEFGKKGFVIATQDRELKEKLKKAGIEILVIKQRKRIEKG